MTSQKRVELESYVCDLEKRVAEVEAILKQKQEALSDAREALEERRKRVSHHETNWNFMRQNAKIIDIKEYRGVEKLLAKARADYSVCAALVAQLFTAVEHFKKTIETASAEIARHRTVLGTYGQVIKWRAA